jgi:DNA-binding CsgD family transcriptional regulator
MAPAVGPATASLVSRDLEIGRVERFLDELVRRPLVLIVGGEAGIGKTTLWNSGLELARLRGFRVCACRPVESEARLGFSALSDLLQPVAEGVFAKLPFPQRRAIDAALLRGEAGREPPDRRAVAVATLGLLRTLAKSAPVLVAVDDLPWLDRASARTLEYVLRRLEAEPVGLLATSRSDDSPKVGSTLEHLLPSGRLQRLELGPLTLGAFGTVLAARQQTALRRPTLVRLYEASGGNPFFGLELAAALAALGREPKPGEPLPVPASLRALMRGRLAALPAPGRKVALLVAAAPRPTVSVVEASMGEPSEARQGLDAAATTGVLQIVEQEIRFVHPLLRSLAYSDATPDARRLAHRRLAEAVREEEERARHLALGTDTPDESIAAELDGAAHGAYQRGAPEVAAELADLALAFTPVDHREARVRRLVEAGELHFAAFDLDEARQLLEEAIASSSPGAGRADALHRLAKVLRYSETAPAATALLRQALGEAGLGSTLQVALHRDLGFVLLNMGDVAGIEHYRRALELAEQIGDRALIAQMLGLLAVVEFALGNGVRQDLIGRSLRDATATEYLPMELRPKVIASHILGWSDDLAGARALLQDEYLSATERGAETDLPLLLVWLVDLEVRAGNWELADHYAEQGYEAALTSAAATSIALLQGARSILRACQGRVDNARTDAEAAIELGQRCGWYFPVLYGVQALGLLELSLGDAAAAHTWLEPQVQALLAMGALEPGMVPCLPDEIESLLRLGQLDAAGQLLARFETAGLRLDRRWAIATGGRCRALLHAMQGNHDAAAEALGAAFSAHERLSMPFELGRTHLVAGEVFRRARRKLVARDHLERARKTFESLGAPLWSRKVNQELERLGLSRTRQRELTSAERRVLELAAAGRSNREIAEQLFMGLRTVEAHLSRGYGKLGVRRRTQLSQALAAPAEEG